MTAHIPSRETCLVLMDREGMLPHIKAHSLQVARVALGLGGHLNPPHPNLDMPLIEAGALLHDIAKTPCLKTKGNHALIGEEMVRAMGFESVACIVGQHVRLENDPLAMDRVDEIILVHYADKRVRHDEVVDLEERFDYLVQTYGRSPEAVERIKALYQETLEMEKKIFLHLPFSPRDLKEHLPRLYDEYLPVK
jgi:uncharacterized protein